MSVVHWVTKLLFYLFLELGTKSRALPLLSHTPRQRDSILCTGHSQTIVMLIPCSEHWRKSGLNHNKIVRFQKSWQKVELNIFWSGLVLGIEPGPCAGYASILPWTRADSGLLHAQFWEVSVLHMLMWELVISTPCPSVHWSSDSEPTLLFCYLLWKSWELNQGFVCAMTMGSMLSNS